MRCKKCKTPLRKGSKFCPKCGANVKHTARNFLLIVLAAALLLGGAGAASWKLGLFQTTDGVVDENFTLLSGTFTDRLIVDQESALAAIGDVADILGIEDVNAEFSECKVDTVSGNTYYRFYQEYEGIPVYGRSVVVVADESGGSLSLSGNYLNSNGVNISPKIDEEFAVESVKQNYGESSKIFSKGLVIYSLDGHIAELAWKLYVYSQDGPMVCFFSAQSGEEINSNPLTYAETAIGYKASDTKYQSGFETVFTGNDYLLYDVSRDFIVLWLRGEKSIDTIKDIWGQSIKDENGNTYDFFQLFTQGELVRSENNIFGDTQEEIDAKYEDAAQLLIGVSSISDVYENLGFHRDRRVYLFYDDGYDNGDNAFGGTDPDTWDYAILSVGQNIDINKLDILTHEYTHIISKLIVQWAGEDSGLNEGISDVMGELIEAILLESEPDWNNGYRNMITPADYSDFRSDMEGHVASILISHPAYLMYTGIGGNPNYQALSTEDLAHLFYETLYTLPSDCTFSQFRTLVENTANIMCQQGALTEKQRLCVSNAFFQVGIAPTTTPVAKKLTLDVYGVDGLPYEDYTLYVRHYSGAEKTYTSETITKEGISFPTIGSYELCIVDNANTDNQTSITVKVVDHGGAAELPVFTQCGLSKIDGPIIAPSSDNSTPLEAYMEAANRTTATGSWTEDMNMTASMVLKNGSSTTKTKATMEASVDIEGWNGTDTSSLYMSGTASMSVLNQTIAYTMTWQNGTAHYEYTEPTVTSADLKIDPSYFNFNSLTDDMIISSAMNGNQITFSIQGDALTKAGISAVNSLLSGVENLSYEDAMVNVTVNEQSGKIDALTMTFRASMTYQGYDAEADYEIQYEFSEHEGAEKSEDVTNSNQDLSDLQARFFVKDVDSGLNLRSLPQHDSNLEGTIYDDTIMYFYGEIGQGLGSDGVMHEWYKVMADQELIGWVRSDLIKEIFIESEPEKPTSYLEDLSYDAWDRYTGNEGDSFIEKVGTRNSSTDINGVEYSHGLECWVARWNYKNETSWVWKEWVLNKSYSTIQGEITVSDDCYNKNNYMTNIEFVGDGGILCSYTLTPGTNYPIAFSIDISQVETLRISVEDDGSFSGGTSFILGNITLT